MTKETAMMSRSDTQRMWLGQSWTLGEPQALLCFLFSFFFFFFFFKTWTWALSRLSGLIQHKHFLKGTRPFPLDATQNTSGLALAFFSFLFFLLVFLSFFFFFSFGRFGNKFGWTRCSKNKKEEEPQVSALVQTMSFWTQTVQHEEEEDVSVRKVGKFVAYNRLTGRIQRVPSSKPYSHHGDQAADWTQQSPQRGGGSRLNPQYSFHVNYTIYT